MIQQTPHAAEAYVISVIHVLESVENLIPESVDVPDRELFEAALKDAMDSLGDAIVSLHTFRNLMDGYENGDPDAEID